MQLNSKHVCRTSFLSCIVQSPCSTSISGALHLISSDPPHCTKDVSLLIEPSTFIDAENYFAAFLDYSKPRCCHLIHDRIQKTVSCFIDKIKCCDELIPNLTVLLKKNKRDKETKGGKKR